MDRTARLTYRTAITHSNRQIARAAVFALSLGAFSAAAQSVVAPPPPPPDTAVLTSGASGEVFKTPQTAPIQWGDVGVHPHVFYRLTYGDGVQVTPGLQEKTTVHSVSPGLAFDYGSHWTADYTPTWTFYSNEAFRDTVAHNASLKGAAGFTDGQLVFSEQYARSSDPLIETGRQTRQESSATSLTATYALGTRSRIDASIGYNLRYVDIAPDSRDWSTHDWLHYQFTNRLDGAVGFGLGYTAIDPGADMSYAQELVRIGWRPLDKLFVDIHGGREQRKFRKSNTAKLNNPNYGAAVTYQPIETTALSFSADRSVGVSYFADQATQHTSWSLGFDQRLLQHFHLSGSVGRSKNEYIAAASTVVTAREDRTTSSSLRLSTSFLRRGTIAIVYLHTHNSSSASGYTFTSDQTGLELGYRY